MLESEQKFFVDLLCFFTGLVEQPLALREWVVQFGVTRGDLLAIDDQLKNIDHRIVFAVLSGQWDQFFRRVCDENRVERFFLDQLFEDDVE